MATLTFLDVIREYPWFASLSAVKWQTLCQALYKFDSNPSPEDIISISKQIDRPSKQVDYFFKAAFFGQSMPATLDKLEKESSGAGKPTELGPYSQMKQSSIIWIKGEPTQAFGRTPEEETECLTTGPIILPDLPIQSGGPGAGAAYVHGARPTSMHDVPQPGDRGGSSGGGALVRNKSGNGRPLQTARREYPVMNDLIPLVNKLQDVFNTIGSDSIDLPQIVVVGSQSSGKSSVLETIVQKDFLPRGNGVVTRRPLVLQLVNTHQTGVPQPPSSVSSDGSLNESPDRAEFLHLPNKQFFDFEEVRKEIEAETARVAGQNKAISRTPIHLKIYSRNVLNLTLVDLPGVTKIPVGDQPTDIEKQTRNLILDYILKPNSVILAVSPANVDLANSDSLKLARQVDPEAKRTIGVLTKLDLMDAGTNSLDILSGRAYPLKLGFIGVVNRSQADIQSNKPMADAFKAETEFFQNHPAYRAIAHRCGTNFLAKTLNTILMNHIRDKLPDIKAKLNSLIGQTQQELTSYGDPSFTGKAHRGSLILQLLTRFASDFVAAIDGTSSEISTKELCGGARIYYIFNNVFGAALDSVNPCENLSVQDIRTAIRNSTGPRPSLFVPEIAFDLLVKPQIKLLEPPSLRCVELAYEELVKICHSCGGKDLARFPRFHAKLIEVVSDLLRERLGPTSDYVESLISIQRSYINTNHPDFIGGGGAMSALERAAQKKKKEIERTRKPSTHNVILAGGESHVAREDAGEKSLTNAVANLTVQQAEREKGHARQGSHSGSISSVSSVNGSINGPSPSSGAGAGKDTFLNYFFGGPQQRSDRPVLQETRAMSQNVAKEMVMPKTVLDGEPLDFDKKLDHMTGAEEFSNLSDREDMETQLIRSLITSYFNITRKSIQDLVPKAVMHLLVNYSREAVQNRLVATLYKEELFNDLLQEDDSLSAERAKCKAMLDVFKNAFSVINEAM
ncbi:Dynamin- GTPase protein [Podila epicladia]|nr:Dynamin- GTPase protein [Podila epicladia]KAG0092163.1 Dynamin- GTPase protein [Podila epicladia]